MYQMDPFLHAHESQASIQLRRFRVETSTCVSHLQPDLVRYARSSIANSLIPLYLTALCSPS